MDINLNEIKSRGLLFGKNSYAFDAERAPFLIEPYQRITNLLSEAAATKTQKTKVIES
jgi:hypothetical protein